MLPCSLIIRDLGLLFVSVKLLVKYIGGGGVLEVNYNLNQYFPVGYLFVVAVLNCFLSRKQNTFI